MLSTKQNVKSVWGPIPFTSQVVALDSRADETLYHGTRGPGKTAIQLGKFARYVGLGFGSFWRGIVVGRTTQALKDIIEQSKRMFPLIFGDKCTFYESMGNWKWQWESGETLLFKQCKEPKEYFDNFHGQEYPFIGFHELVQWPTSEVYDLISSTNRSSWTPEKNSPVDKSGNYILKRIPLIMFSTTNSEGAGHNWVKSTFIDPAPMGKVHRIQVEITSPKTKEKVIVTRTRVAIFGSYIENIYLDDAYIANLNIQCRNNENRRKSWLFGSWDIVSGGVFGDNWNRAVHVKPLFQVPDNWYVDRAFDWGSLHPFSVGWFAEANGETVKLSNGQLWTPARGSLIQFAEWYGTEKIGTNKGIKLSAKNIAIGIKEREAQMKEFGLYTGTIYGGPADNQIGNQIDSDSDTLEEIMRKQGISWKESDKSKGSRANGLQLVKQRFENSLTGEGPGLYLTENCRASISTIPILPYDEDLQAVGIEDVDTTSEDHPYDMLRYRVLAGNRKLTTGFKVTFAN